MELEELAETEWAVLIDDDVRFEPVPSKPHSVNTGPVWGDGDPVWVDGDPDWVDAYEI